MDTQISPLLAAQSKISSSGMAGLDHLQTIGERSKSGKKLSDKEMEQVGKQFESLLLHQLLSAMRKTVPENELFGNTPADEMYKDMFDQQIAEQVADSGQTGISQSITEEIRRQQDQVRPPKEEGTRFLPLKREATYSSLPAPTGLSGPPPRPTQSFYPLPSKGDMFRAINTYHKTITNMAIGE
jgi:flagellar protein FlgJ